MMRYSKNKKRLNKWFVPMAIGGLFLLLLALAVVNGIRNMNRAPENPTTFDSRQWKVNQGHDYPFRNSMLQDLMLSDTLKPLKKAQVLELLGAPDRMDKQYLFYQVRQERIGGFFPLSTKTLVIKLGDSLPNKVMIHQ